MERPVSVAGIATAYGLDGPGIESRWGARFSAPVQTGPEAHPASRKMGTGSFPGLKCGRGVKLTPHPRLVPRSKISRAIPLLSLRAFVAYERVNPTYNCNGTPKHNFCTSVRSLVSNCGQESRQRR